MIEMLLAIMFTTLVSENVRYDISYEERKKIEIIRNNCEDMPADQIDPFYVLRIIRIEKRLALPKELDGLIPAVICIESKFQPAADLWGDQGRARGPAQFHEALAAPCIRSDWFRNNHWRTGHDWRADIEFSAVCWVHNMYRLYDRAEKKCGPERAFQHSEAAVSNPIKYFWRVQEDWTCDLKSRHWELMEKWHELSSV